jgi:D-alanyl-D-alanine carboxypeptidase
MTALLALKYGNLTDTVTVTDDAVITEAGSSLAGIKPGDVMSLEDLLYGLMIPSGNDAANAIAVHVAGSIDAFVDMMNEEARRIGATGTHFANANGLTDPEHYTTAYDLYLIFHEAMKYETFRTVIGTLSYTASYKDGGSNDKTLTWSAGNYYMTGKKEVPEGLEVLGGKTGTTKAAGYCLIMGSKADDGNEYASVIMNAESRDALYEDMTKIINKIVK